jgi:hypothetical protein
MNNLRVLVACEYSGAVRRAMLACGYDAWSCDLLPSEDSSNRHIQGDVRRVLADGWDLLAVMHPPCTVMCNSGAKHLYNGGRKANGRNKHRWDQLLDSAKFYCELRDYADIPCRLVENPVMHGHAIELTRRGYTQFVHPYWFGDPFFKLTGFELINLPDLKPTNLLLPPKPGTDQHKAWSACHRAPPSPDRWKDRSRTYPGIASALADQMGRAACAYLGIKSPERKAA